MKTRPEVDFSSPLCQPYEVRQGEHGVLLMHGFAGSAAHMRPLAEGLVQQGFGVRTINLPGHATTMDDMRRCSWQDWLNAAKEAFREMKEQYRFVSVTGLSMGGCLTLMIAEQSDPTAIAPISAPMGVLPTTTWGIPDFRRKARWICAALSTRPAITFARSPARCCACRAAAIRSSRLTARM